MVTDQKKRRSKSAKAEPDRPSGFDEGLRKLSYLSVPEPARSLPTNGSSVPATKFLTLGRMMETNGGSTLERVPGFDRARARNRGLLPMNVSPVDYLASEKSSRFRLEGDDVGNDLVLIADPTDIPWRCIARLEIAFEKGRKQIGTAWFMSDRCLATAGHNIFSFEKDGGLAKEIIVSPAFDGVLPPFRTFDVVQTYCDKRWLAGDDENSEFDFGALRLSSPVAGDALGCFGFASFKDNQFTRFQANICGYANDRFPKSQYFSGGRLLEFESKNSKFLNYDFETAGGMSGAPVFGLFDKQRVVVGIHIQGPGKYSRARRIDPDVYKALRTFIDLES